MALSVQADFSEPIPGIANDPVTWRELTVIDSGLNAITYRLPSDALSLVFSVPVQAGGVGSCVLQDFSDAGGGSRSSEPVTFPTDAPGGGGVAPEQPKILAVTVLGEVPDDPFTVTKKQVTPHAHAIRTKR